jgi:flagellar L-ring protein FlgH
MEVRTIILAGALAAGSAAPAFGQSSSLFNEPVPAQAPVVPMSSSQVPDRLAPAIARASYSAVRVPEPKRFAVQDLVQIIVRESTESDSESSLETKKDSKYDGEISDFPMLNIKDLLDFAIKPNTFPNGTPKVGVSFKSDFSGDGEASRKDTFTGRIQARIIDVKPNGTLVLEARKFIAHDKETLEMVLTGVCRKEDIAADNTILSTQLADLRLDKKHTGELRRTAKKGIFTRVMDGIFNF